MPQPLKDAIGICKTIMRNGFDAYIISTVLQHEMLMDAKETEVDIATEMDKDNLQKVFPQLSESNQKYSLGKINEGETVIRFYPTEVSTNSYLDSSLVRFTPRILKKLELREELPVNLACPYITKTTGVYEGFCDWDNGEIKFAGLPEETLRKNLILGVRALRFSVNFHLPIEANSWIAIVRNSQEVLDFCSVKDIMDEWRKVEAENLWKFVQLLYDAFILGVLIPEVAALSRVRQQKNESGIEENVLEHTIETMRYYTEQLPFDWYGTMACLLHDVGKLHTAEYINNNWIFYQHHHIGAKIARKTLRRLMFMPEDIDLICHLVKNHKRFDFMLTERGIRRFKALDEYPRLIEISRANIKARQGNYTSFNHNLKYLERADVPEEMTEPLLNGNEIMEFANLKPGPAVGVIRESLLKAQIAEIVTTVPEAVEFVRNYKF